ncbi:MAG: NFACT family protein [Spirochaetes bacterium]|nr:NFACT family protein [Spirochaetota bacterium]
MSLNWKEIDLILWELPFSGSRIQEIRQPDFKSLVLELYQPKGPWKLYVNLSATACRLHRLTQKPLSSIKPQRFMELLRSRIRGGRILEATQPGGNRIVRIEVLRGEERLILWIRLWGPASNILLTDEKGTILDAFYRRPKQKEVSGEIYAPVLYPAIQEGLGSKSLSHTLGKVYEVRPYPKEQSFSDYIEQYYRIREEEEQRKKLIADLEKQLNTQETKLHSRLSILIKKKEEYSNFEQWKTQGDLILSHITELRKGDPILSISDPHTGKSRVIPLSPTLSPAENAETYYRKYKKAKAGLQILEDEIRSMEGQLKQLEMKRALLRTEKDLKVIASLLNRPTPKKKGGLPETTPGLSFTSQDFTILVGRTAQENDELLRHHVKGNDLWLHTRDYPGAYVFIRAKPGKSVPLETLLDAGNLAVFYSKARESGHADLYYTQVKYLRRAKGAKLGTVLPTQEKNLSVKLEEHRLQRLLYTESET